MNPPALPPGGGRRVGYPEAHDGRPGRGRRTALGFYGSEWRTGPGAPDGLGYQPRIPPWSGTPRPARRSVSPRRRTCRPAGYDARVGGKTRRPVRSRRRPRLGWEKVELRRPSREREKRGETPASGRGRGNRPGAALNPPRPSASGDDFFSPAQPPVTGSAQKPVMILPQVHLRKPCYDFYFL